MHGPVALRMAHPSYSSPSCRFTWAPGGQQGSRAVGQQSSRPGSQCSSSRRDMLELAIWAPLQTAQLGAWQDLLMRREPERGSCPTCIGAVDDTLGSCSTTPSCVSTYDDAPDHFIAPWQHEARGRQQALDQLELAVQQAGAVQVERSDPSGYLYAVFDEEPSYSLPLGLISLPKATDDVEFLISDDSDTRVEIRSASRLPNLPDGGRQRKRLEAIRLQLGWEQVPIIRNRSRTLVVIESPWDTFGPTPPASESLGGLRFEDGNSD